MVFAHISVKGWIIDPYVQSLFYCSHLVQVLPPNNVEVVNGNIVTSDVAEVIYGRGGFQMFLEPFTKHSWGLSNIFLITIHPVTLVSVDDSTLLLDWIFVFWSHQEVLDCGASFEVHLYPKLSANVLDALTSKEAPQSRTSWWLQKTKIQYRSKVESSTDTNVTGWIVIRNILESPQECLVKGSRNIWNPPLPYMTTATSLVTMLPLTTSTLLGGRTWTRWEQ